MSWAQQRQAIKLAAEAGVRARTSAAGSETLPLTHHHLRYAMLSRPNGELTRAGQYYYQLIGRPPPSRQYDRNQPLIREGPNDYIMLRGGAKKLLRSLQPNGNYQLTKLGKHFFKDKWVDWVVHVPVIIRGVRRNGRNRGMPYERTKRLPVTDLNVALSRQSEGLSDAQAARNLKASVLAQLGNPEPNDIILELSDETYYLDATREWTFSQQANVRPRLLLQIRPHRREVRADRGPGPGQIPRREEPGETPEFKDWREWEGEVASGHFYAEGAPGREALPQGGHAEHERVAAPAAAQDCVICAFEDLDVLQAWVSRLGLPYRGQRLQRARSSFTFLRRAAIRPALGRLCSRSRNISASSARRPTCELDHIVPVHQSFSAQAQNLQALCLECHRNKTGRVYEAYVESPRLPPLVFKLNSHKPDHICHGIDVVRCRKDNMEQAREGHLADLTYVKLQEDGRWAAFPRLPYVGEGWYAKPAVAYMLEKGIATWNDFAWSLDATAHVDQESVTQALQQMEAAWPEGEEHYAKLSVNALIGLWARNMDLIYTMRTSNHQFDGSGCMPAPRAVPGRRGRDALGPHLRDPAAVQPELSARARLRDGLGVCGGLPHPGCTRNRAVEVP